MSTPEIQMHLLQSGEYPATWLQELPIQHLNEQSHQGSLHS